MIETSQVLRFVNMCLMCSGRWSLLELMEAFLKTLDLSIAVYSAYKSGE